MPGPTLSENKFRQLDLYLSEIAISLFTLNDRWTKLKTMKQGRFHCQIGAVLKPEELEMLRGEFQKRRRWFPALELVAPIVDLGDRYNCPHRFSIAKGRHYCISQCYLRHFASAVPAAAKGGVKALDGV